MLFRSRAFYYWRTTFSLSDVERRAIHELGITRLYVRAFDVVEPTESWQMGNGEIGLSSALLHRDFRDYYGRHGGEAYLRVQGGDDADLTLSLSDEQWGDRRDRDPWTLTRGDEPWRPNPVMDVGTMHLLTTRLRVDTRASEGSAWAG